ncbi:MAG: N-acetylmuramoyl-L-alanine amidase [Defluviitaleaceae bacterium]|nr:N-acetylmuramoyl-L-alanine amidase [Defluviitaleaceae bacterium]
MNNNRKRIRKRKRRLRFRGQFLVLMAAIAIGIFAYYITNIVAVDEDAEGRVPRYLEHIDISLLRTNFDDGALVYTFYYENIEVDMWRHHVSDSEGLVYSIMRSPYPSFIRIYTNAPAIFLTEYDYATRTVHITVINPRNVFERIVVIDPGHGGADDGATVGNIRESDIVLDISFYLYALFQNSNSGIKAYMTRIDDSFVEIANRAEFANTVGDMLVSVHTNAYRYSATVAGTETLFLDDSSMDRYGNLGRFNLPNSVFSQIMQDHLVEELGTRDRGLVERPDLRLLNESSIPAAYVEIDFKTNPQALANLTNSQYQQRIAQALYEGIVHAFALATSNE